jgi:hypothetical protein
MDEQTREDIALEGWPAIKRCACGCNVGRLHADGVRCADCDRRDVEGEAV